MRDSFVTWTIGGMPRPDDIAEARRLSHLTAIRGARSDVRRVLSFGIASRVARLVRPDDARIGAADCCSPAG